MIIGHEKLINDFKKLATDGNLAHGYLFFGTPRVGKKLFAVYLANFLENGKFEEPKILTDFFLIEPGTEKTTRGDGSTMLTTRSSRTIGIDQVRQLKNFLMQKPIMSKLRTAVINDSEFMTSEAQNAILKIAEEPPQQSLLIIIANDSEMIMPTLSSRLQKKYFSSVKKELVKKLLKETGVSKDEEAKKFADESFGQPGLAKLMAMDENFRLSRVAAENFLKSGFWERRNMIKSLLDRDDFNLSVFLETLLIIVSGSTKKGKNFNLWHKISALRRDSDIYNVNPRLQLEALLTDF